jgi:hypothetical protein
MRQMYNRNKKRILKSINDGSVSQSRTIIGEVYKLISRSNLILLCVTIDKPKKFLQNPECDIEYLAWKLLMERLNICIDKISRSRNSNEYGIIMMDEKDREKDLRIRNYLKSLRKGEVKSYQNFDRIIEDPIFTPSDWRNLSQLADAVVTCSKFYIKKESLFVTQFLTIMDKFDKNKNGEIMGSGFKIY